MAPLAKEREAEIRKKVRDYDGRTMLWTQLDLRDLLAEIDRLRDELNANETLMEGISEVAKERDRLRNNLAEARRDVARLDWLLLTPASVYASVDPEGNRLMHFVAVPESNQNTRRGFVAPTIRAAIDAARQDAQPKEGTP